jgi:ribosomal protein S18 acetylase RimI-like enzyme
MTSGVAIRPYEDRDLNGVIAVARDLQQAERILFARMKSPNEIGESYVQHIRSEVQKHEGTLLVAELAGAIVGYCSLHTHCDSSDEADEVHYHFAHVGDLAVAEAQRSSGIGALLIEEASRIARAAGLSWLRLSVLASNAAARRFYARLGFAEHLIKVEKAL